VEGQTTGAAHGARRHLYDNGSPFLSTPGTRVGIRPVVAVRNKRSCFGVAVDRTQKVLDRLISESAKPRSVSDWRHPPAIRAHRQYLSRKRSLVDQPVNVLPELFASGTQVAHAWLVGSSVGIPPPIPDPMAHFSRFADRLTSSLLACPAAGRARCPVWYKPASSNRPTYSVGDPAILGATHGCLRTTCCEEVPTAGRTTLHVAAVVGTDIPLTRLSCYIQRADQCPWPGESRNFIAGPPPGGRTRGWRAPTRLATKLRRESADA
jgi:hypothetical protein